MESKVRKYNRVKIYNRDSGICQVCKRKIYEIENKYRLPRGSFYECGHIIDRCIGYDDNETNLVAMCKFCNQTKPLHSSIEEYEEWVKNGSSNNIFQSMLKNIDEEFAQDTEEGIGTKEENDESSKRVKEKITKKYGNLSNDDLLTIVTLGFIQNHFDVEYDFINKYGKEIISKIPEE